MAAPARSSGERPLPWLAPLVLLMALFYLYPLVDVLWLGFTASGSAAQPAGDLTLANFTAFMRSPELASMARVTLIFVAASVAGQLVMGLFIAALLDEGERRRLPGAAFVRSVVLVGWVLPGVVVGLIWRLLLDESSSGLLAHAFSALGASDMVFLSTPGAALLWVTVANIWRGTAFSMLLQYSAMKTIAPELYEAAKVDGAGTWQRFVFITVPSLRRILLINLILITIATINTFDMIMPLTGGGPGRATEVVALYIYNLVFVQFALGRGAAVATLLMLAGLALTTVYLRLLARAEERDA